MPYFSINIDGKVVIDLPDFQKNFNDRAIFEQVIPQFDTEESNFRLLNILYYRIQNSNPL